MILAPGLGTLGLEGFVVSSPLRALALWSFAYPAPGGEAEPSSGVHPVGSLSSDQGEETSTVKETDSRENPQNSNRFTGLQPPLSDHCSTHQVLVGWPVHCLIFNYFFIYS